MMNIIAVPERFKYTIGKTKCQCILYCFFTQIMIYSVNLIFMKTFLHFIVQLYGGLQIVSKRFFHDDPFPAGIFTLVMQTLFSQAAGNCFIQTGWGSKIVNIILSYLIFFINLIQFIFQVGIIIWRLGIDTLIIDLLQKFLQFIILYRRFFTKLFYILHHFISEGIIAVLTSGYSQNCKFIR